MKKLAYTFSKLFFYIFTFVFFFVFIFSLLSFTESNLGWDVPFVDVKNYEGKEQAFINLPLFKFSFVFPSNSLLPVIVMSFILLFYVFYFYALKEFFKLFVQEFTFTSLSVKRLLLFYKLNFIPIVIGFIGAIYSAINQGRIRFDEEHFFLIIHLFVAFLIYLYLDLIKKGQKIQEENDLTI